MFTKFSGRLIPSFKNRDKQVYIENHNRYLCNKCLKEYLYSFQAHDCEISHTCKHKKFRYQLIHLGYDGFNDEYTSQSVGLYEICDNCNTTIRSLTIEEQDDKIKDILDKMNVNKLFK